MRSTGEQLRVWRCRHVAILMSGGILTFALGYIVYHFVLFEQTLVNLQNF
jgi:membrane protein YqaA with SNARE-associated domain